MSTILFFAGMIAIFFVVLHSLDRFVWEPKRRREAEAAPRITLAETQSFWNAIEDSALPIAIAVVQDRSPQSPQESRIGGAPLAIGDDTSWPKGSYDGFPMAFVAQINFAELPPMEDFPANGILQIYSSFEMIKEDGECEKVIRWDANPQSDEVLDIPEDIQKTTRQTQAFSEKARRVGLPLVFETGSAPGNPFNWPFEENNLLFENRLPENDEAAAIMEDWEDRCTRIIEGYKDHWVGGHPRFVQIDIRGAHPELRHLDRVLFHLGCDREINLGDSGEVNVMISRKALLKEDFENVHVSWDCC